MELVITLTVKF